MIRECLPTACCQSEAIFCRSGQGEQVLNNCMRTAKISDWVGEIRFKIKCVTNNHNNRHEKSLKSSVVKLLGNLKFPQIESFKFCNYEWLVTENTFLRVQMCILMSNICKVSIPFQF